MTTKIVLLAAGKGKRMKNQRLPKVLVPLHGRPMICYILDAIDQSGLCPNPVIVIGHGAELVRQTLGDRYTYVVQKEQKGTGHAVACAKEALIGQADNILVLCGDKPYLSTTTIIKMAEAHSESQRVMTMATIQVADFSGWRQALLEHGRIVRDARGRIIKTVEQKDAAPKELEIKELTIGTMCFRADWLWQNIARLKNDNKQGEYYLPDLLKIAIEDGEEISTVEVEPREGLGINSLEQLEIVSGA